MLPLNLHLRRKKKTEYPDVSTPFSGFLLEENTLHDSKDAVYHCLVKGLLIFTASFGCVSGVLSEFQIAYNMPLVLAVLFFSSMALSFIHLKKWLFNLGYPVLFVVFVTMLLRCRMLANSGFQALINIINEEYSSHFLMLFTRESTETIADRYLTITAAAIFLGVFLAILINVGIFQDMYFCTTLNLTFWPLQLGIYIGKYPSFLSIALLFFSYFTIYMLKHSGHYHFIYPGKKKEYTHTYRRKGDNYVFYKSNAGNMAQLCLFGLVLALFISAFGSASLSRSEAEASTSGSLKTSVDSYVKILVQNGLSGLFNRYEATGGISNGQLGGVSSVRPDYETDLIVTFVPYAYETLYLKAFVGAEYTGSSWKEPGSVTDYQYPQDVSGSQSDYHIACAYTEGEALQAMMEDSVVPAMSATMIVENVDAAPNHLYLPYYISPITSNASATQENILKGVTPQGSSVMLNYIPYSPSQTDLDDRKSSDFSAFRDTSQSENFLIYTKECYDNYLQIPDEILPTLMDYQDEIGTGSSLTEQIFLIRQFLTLNYTYDMAPGTTPRNEDFVTYFLDTQKKGYCAHFASAATLLFRSYGIPARYVEGYVISQSAVSERAQATEYDADDFFTGENILGSSNVVEVEVNDGDAHAWVEIFVDGFGWMPVEVTPPSQDEEETTYGDFLSALSSLFGTSTSIQGSTSNTNVEYHDLFSSLHFENSPVMIVFLSVLALALLCPLILTGFRSLYQYTRRRKAYRNGIYDTCIAYEYQKLHKHLSRKYPTEQLTLPEDIGIFLERLLADSDTCKANRRRLLPDTFAVKSRSRVNNLLQNAHTTVAEQIALTEKSCFSGKQVSKETADLLIHFYHYSCSL
jgi:hypothetical protein